jgi:hypothetical protein
MKGPLFPDLVGDGLPDSPPCPWCEGRDTRVLSPFGGQLSVAQCWCNHCRTGFEYLKWEAGPDARSRRAGPEST